MSSEPHGIDALCRALIDAGIATVFGVPGTQTVPLFEGFRQSKLRTVLSSHELAASFMANGHYRASGRMAALSTIPGPGFTYALTGLAEARLDSAALLHIVPPPASAPGQRFQLQRLDQRAIAVPLVKGIVSLSQSRDAFDAVHDAVQLATRGEPGPVMLEVDVAALANSASATPDASQTATATPTSVVDAASAELRSVFAAADRPVFLLGQGALGCADQLSRLAESLAIPIVTTPAARGIVAEDRPLSIPFDPLRGNVDAVNALFANSDIILALGCKLGHNGSAGFELALPADRLVHVDAEPGTAGANYAARMAITARVEDLMSNLESRSRPTAWLPGEIAAFRQRVRVVAPSAETRMHGVAPAEFFAWLRQTLPRDAMVVTDSGFHQILTRRHFDVLAPRGLIVPNDLQSMGYGLPAAIGAKLAAPERCVVAIVGDGGFLMSGMELLTARREGIGITVIVFNDGHLNQIRLHQQRDFGHAHAVDLLNPDFATLAEAFGVDFIRLGEATRPAFAQALTSARPTLVEVPVGDSAALRRAPVVARAKSIARSLLGSQVKSALRSILGRKGR